MADARNIEGMARFGIRPKTTVLGISVWEIRRLAKETGRNHRLARELWNSGIHEAQILASYVEEPDQVTDRQLEEWVADLDSWDICDQVVELIARTPFAARKIKEWSRREDEFVKRAAFSLIAETAIHGKEMPNEKFVALLDVIKREATDERNFVRKSVNWALRQIGKRNRELNRRAVAAAKEIQKMDSRAARWIAADALRELTSPKVQERLAGETPAMPHRPVRSPRQPRKTFRPSTTAR